MKLWLQNAKASAGITCPGVVGVHRDYHRVVVVGGDDCIAEKNGLIESLKH